MPINEATRKVLADGIEVYMTTDGVRVLKIPMRCMEDRREEYEPTGDRKWLDVDRSYQQLYINELREVRKWNGGHYEPLDLDGLLPRLARTTAKQDGSFRYEVIDNWFTRTRKGFDKATFDREYRCRDIPDLGSLVYPQFLKRSHVVPLDVVPYDPQQPILRGWDCGHVTPAVVWGQIDKDGRLVIYHSHFEKRMGATEFARVVNNLSAAYFPNARMFRDFGDPAGSVNAGTGTWFDELAAEGIYVYSSHRHGVKPEERVSRIRGLLTQIHGELPMLVIVKTHDNEPLIHALEAGYHYNSTDKIEKNHPSSDLANCVEYIVVYGLNVPAKVYGGSYQKQREQQSPFRNRRKRALRPKNYAFLAQRGVRTFG